MKMSIFFHDLTPEEAAGLIALHDIKGTIEQLEPKAKPAKRKRRTNAEIAVDKAAESEPTPPSDDTGPAVAEANVKRGRKKRGGGVDPTLAPSKRQKRGTKPSSSATKSPSDDITDIEVSRVASEGAQALLPKYIVQKLEEFGVAIVNELSQEQRREFVDDVQAAIEEAK